MIKVVSTQNPLFSMKIFIAGHFLSDFPDGSASCDKAALSHWATELRKRGWISLASSEHAGSGFDACPPFFPLPALHDKFASCANWSTLKTLFSAASSHCSTSALFLFFFFFSTPALISAEETSQCRSCQSRTWGSACWECFWGSCWRSLLTDPTLCLGHPGGTKVRLDYAWC